MKKKDLVIAIPKEIQEGCRCVAVIPQTVKQLTSGGHTVLVQKGAGSDAFYLDEEYEAAGARIMDGANDVYSVADVVLKIYPPRHNDELNNYELDMMKEGATVIGFLSPISDASVVEKLRKRRLTGFAMELIPRISRAQGMDALSSFSTVMGYRAVLLAAGFLGKFFPLLMTAAGTIQPANVLVIGAGVAGLQAIAVSHRMGAKVEAFDTRPVVREQVESLGARFVEMELPEDMETRYGYAKEAPEEFIRREMEAIEARLHRTDVVITTALVYGKKAPLLITEQMVSRMRPGSVIVDLAAEQGGNCQLTVAGETVERNGVIVHGPVNLPSQLPFDASLMYSKNILNAFNNLYHGEDDSVDLEDEINANALVTYKGEVVSETVKHYLEGKNDR